MDLTSIEALSLLDQSELKNADEVIEIFSRVTGEIIDVNSGDPYVLYSGSFDNGVKTKFYVNEIIGSADVNHIGMSESGKLLNDRGFQNILSKAIAFEEFGIVVDQQKIGQAFNKKIVMH